MSMACGLLCRPHFTLPHQAGAGYGSLPRSCPTSMACGLSCWPPLHAASPGRCRLQQPPPPLVSHEHGMRALVLAPLRAASPGRCRLKQPPPLMSHERGMPAVRGATPHLLSISLGLQGCHLGPRLPMRRLCCASCLLQRSALLPRRCQLPLQAAVYAVENALLPPAERCMVPLCCCSCQLPVLEAHKFPWPCTADPQGVRSGMTCRLVVA